MCGRIVWIWDAKTGLLIKRYDDTASDRPDVKHVLDKKRYNVPPASHLPVVLGPANQSRVEVARWGFPIPKRPNGVFNTRMETAASSPLWKKMFGQAHCLFIVRGFYEWKREPRRRTPFFIQRADGEPMILAGVWGHRSWRGERALCASILTCGPNDFMRPLHDRMPVVLESADADAWLDADADAATRMARPCPDVLARHEVGSEVGNTKNDRPSLMDAVHQTGLGGF